MRFGKEFVSSLHNESHKQKSNFFVHEPLTLKPPTKQYPGWLTKKKGELPEDEWQQRNEQYMILCRVCELYETQKTPQDNIQEIVILIEKMGQAPQELIDESAAAAPAGSP